MREDVVNAVTDDYLPRGSMDELWDIKGLEEALHHEFDAELPIQQWLDQDKSLHEETLREKLMDSISSMAAEKENSITPELMRRIEKQIMLDVLDRHWKEHLVAMDQLRQGIHLRSFAAKNPKQEYKREAFELFVQMLDKIKHDVVVFLSKVSIRTEHDVEMAENKPHEQDMNFNHPAAPDSLHQEPPAQSPPPASAQQPQAQPFTRQQPKVGRNQPCPCGSGKKYKHCHGKLN